MSILRVSRFAVPAASPQRNAACSAATSGAGQGSMRAMTRPALLAALAALLLIPSTASAVPTELGALPQGTTGSCPGDPCEALTRATAYQAKVGPDRTLYRAPAGGRVVGWSLALGDPSAGQVRGFNEAFGRPQAALVILRPGRGVRHRVVRKGPMTDLTRWLGRTVQFPLTRSLPVRKGDLIAVTVPTWAPIMRLGEPATTSWRASRPAAECRDVTTQRSMLGRRTTADFGCLYRTVRLTYSATFVPYPRR